MAHELLSEVYIDTPDSASALEARIERHLGAAAHGPSTPHPVLRIYVDKNDEFTADRVDDPDEGFLYFPLVLAVEAAPGVNVIAYREALDALLQALAHLGVRFVTAADDEPALWNGGRWDGRAAPARDEPDSR